VSPECEPPDDTANSLGVYSGAIRILENAKSNVGIGTSAGQNIQDTISDLEGNPSLQSAVDLLARQVSSMGESLEATKQQVKSEKDARKGSNVIAIIAILATVITGLPSYLPYLGRDPDSGFQSSLVEAIAGLRQAIAGIQPPVVDCGSVSSPVIRGSRQVAR
jgi:hypothetical protein